MKETKTFIGYETTLNSLLRDLGEVTLLLPLATNPTEAISVDGWHQFCDAYLMVLSGYEVDEERDARQRA